MAEPITVLVIDDDEVDRMSVRRTLRGAGIEAQVVECATVAAAFDQLNAREFDCIFLDFHLPDGTGLEVLRRLQLAAFRAPVIVMTGQGDEETAVEMMKAGAADYIPKSGATVERLRTAVPAVLRVFRAEQGLRDAEERLRIAVDAAEIGTWDYNPETQIGLWSQRTREIFGVPADAIIDIDLINTLIHPDDNHIRSEAMANALSADGTGEYKAEYRIIRPDGSLRWIRATGRSLIRGTGAARKVTRIIGTISDITPQKLAEESLVEAVKMRDDVLAIVSHDLRNPLNTVIASAYLMTDLPLTPEQVAKQLEIIKRTGHHMNRLLQDLLDVSRIDAGRFNVDPAPIDPASIVTDTCAQFEQQVSSKQQAISCSLPDALPNICADRERLAQVFSNLISNAIRHTGQDGRIEIAATVAGDDVEFSVSDNGSGIPAEDLPFIFERFWQARRARRMGAGLGLAIVKGIVEAHGGRIRVESETGRGTTFYFTIPAIPAATLVTAEA